MSPESLSTFVTSIPWFNSPAVVEVYMLADTDKVGSDRQKNICSFQDLLTSIRMRIRTPPLNN